MAEVRWALRARDDLREIRRFIARDSPRAADAQVERILSATECLESYPESGRVLPEFPSLGYRELIVTAYRVIYRIQKDTIWITALVHGARLLRRKSLR